MLAGEPAVGADCGISRGGRREIGRIGRHVAPPEIQPVGIPAQADRRIVGPPATGVVVDRLRQQRPLRRRDRQESLVDEVPA